MNTLHKTLAAAAFAAIGVVTVGAGAASAQNYYDDGYHNGWNDNGWGNRNPSWRTGHRDGDGFVGYDNGYGYGGPSYESGAIDVAVCPPGYHLGRTPGLCWPNR